MSVGPVYWGSYSGETLERLMAVLLAQDHPGAVRRMPSSGDGGVDVLVGTDNGWHVRQIKGFVGRMTANRRKKVERSFSEVVRNPRLDRPISGWALTVPIDPTSAEQQWFEEMTAEASFPCYWEGETFWHGMAAAHPHVIDYYLRDGRSRVEERSATLFAATQAPMRALSALDVAGHLQQLRGLLNRDDPHYRYEFVTGASPPQPSELPAGVVMASSLSTENGQWLTILVMERYRHAIDDSPIGGTLNIRVRDPERGIDLAGPIEEFRTFGVGLQIPAGALDVAMEAPSGLGGTFTAGAGFIGPRMVEDAPERTRLRVADPDNGTLVEVGLRTMSVTRGERGGIEVKATDDFGILTVTFRLPPDGTQLSFSTTVAEMQGRPIQEVLPAVRLLTRFAPPNELLWLEQYGSRVLSRHSFSTVAELLPSDLESFVEDLTVVQDHVRGTVRFPRVCDDSIVRTVAEAAYLLRHGEIRGTWTELELRLEEHAVREEVVEVFRDQGSLVLESSWSLELEGHTYDLGVMHQIAASVQLHSQQPADERAVRLVPGVTDEVVRRLGPIPQG